jgi:hypothetical protein
VDDPGDDRSAQGSSRQKKKELADAIEGLRENGRTTHEGLQAVSLARLVNQVVGYGAVTPWDVGQLTEDWIELFYGLREYEAQQAEEKRQEAESKRRFEDVLRRQRANHPSYGK